MEYSFLLASRLSLSIALSAEEYKISESDEELELYKHITGRFLEIISIIDNNTFSFLQLSAHDGFG